MKIALITHNPKISEGGGVPEVTLDGENGLLVAPEAEQIVNKIDLHLLNSEYAENFGRCAKWMGKVWFPREQVMGRFLEIYGGY